MPRRPAKPTSKRRFKAPPQEIGKRVDRIGCISHPGEFCIILRDEALGIYEIAFMLPGATRPSGIIVKKVEHVTRVPQAAPHVWNWDGNEDAPTVNPEITSIDSGAPWKGFLLRGSFVKTG